VVIGGLLMSDKMGNRVHLIYLTVLANLERVRRYNWGSACLATLYREMTLRRKSWAGVRHCCILGHSITCPSVQQELIADHRICWLRGNMNLKYSYMISIVSIKLILFYLLDGVTVD